MSDSQGGFGRRSGGRMARRVGPLVGAMLASMALFCVSASSAFAEPVGLFAAGEKSEEKAKQPRFEAEKYTATIAGKSTTTHEFTFGTKKFKCASTQFAGTLASANAELALQPVFSSCTFSGFAPAIRLNGCEYRMHLNNVGPPYTGNLEIKCPAGKGIEFEAFASGESICTVTIPAQTGLQSIGLTNAGAGSGRTIAAVFNLSGIKYSQAGAPVFCPAGEFTNGTYTGSETLSATK